MTELNDVWIAGIVTTPALIAAISSILNGREQRRVRRELKETNGKLDKLAGPRIGR